MRLKSALDSASGLREMVDALPLRSAAGRRRVLARAWMSDPARIESAHRRLAEFHRVFCTTVEGRARGRQLAALLGELRDSTAPLRLLAEGGVCDDVALFELKGLARLGAAVAPIMHEAGAQSVSLPDTAPVVELLDPDRTGTASFSLYECYDAELSRLRAARRHGEGNTEETAAALHRTEERVRAELAARLRPYAARLGEALEALADIDAGLAAARQIDQLGLTIPRIAPQGVTRYRGLFHPLVRLRVEQAGGRYQPVDVELGEEPTTVIGANMGGKSVLLRSVALAQQLFQFGFGVPAADAAIHPVGAVCLRQGDAVTGSEELSSFGREVTQISDILRRMRAGEELLVLLDEPARTTNPVEGAALVASLLRQAQGSASRWLCTTHYNLPDGGLRRLKVRGLGDEGMDYRLDEVAAEEVPREALRVAERLGADTAWIDGARALLEKKDDL